MSFLTSLKQTLTALVAGLVVFPVMTAVAAEPAASAEARSEAHRQAAENIRNRLLAARPDIPVLDILPSEVPGFYSVFLPAGQVLHFTADGKYFYTGDLFEVNETLENVSERARATARKALLANADESQMVVFSPAKERVKAQVTVFTDIDCGWCRKLHNEVPEMNRLGIAVRYMAFPRGGLDSVSYDKLVNAWCAEKPQIALTRAKAGEEIPEAKCVNSVAAQYEMAGRMGINSTPSIVLDDGTLMPGYKTAESLADLLGVL